MKTSWLRAFLSWAFVALVLSASPALAQQATPTFASIGGASPSLSEGIAAIVGDAVISTSDVRNRIKLSLLSAGMPDTKDARARVVPQALRSLVDEQLQLQEGKKLDIAVSNEEVDAALKHIAQENAIPGGDMEAFLKQNGIPPSALRTQIKAAITWSKVVMRTLRPRIEVGDDEIAAAAARARANVGKQEYLVSEIFLAVDKPEDEREVQTLAESLVDQIKSGTQFGAVARQFSQNSTANSGGDIGWVQAGQLSPELDRTLQAMQAGSIAGPLRSASGFHILGLREKRTIAAESLKGMKMKLQQAFYPFAETTNKETVYKEAEAISQETSDCADLKEKLEKDHAGWRWQDLGEIEAASAPSWLMDKVVNTETGHATPPLIAQKGALLLFVCERVFPAGSIDKDAIRASIGSERLELLARRHLRDLRREAFIDLRLKAVP